MRPVTKRRVLQILWPSFLMAGVMEMLLFAAVDPNDLQWFGTEPIGASRQAVYTIAFAICWGLNSLACSLTALLIGQSDAADRADPF